MKLCALYDTILKITYSAFPQWQMKKIYKVFNNTHNSYCNNKMLSAS